MAKAYRRASFAVSSTSDALRLGTEPLAKVRKTKNRGEFGHPRADSDGAKRKANAYPPRAQFYAILFRPLVSV